MLVDRKATEAVPALVRMTENADAPMGRLHALWTLEGMGQLQSAEIRKALHDEEAGIRENAIRLAELHLQADPSLSVELLALGGDADPKVRFQLLCALGYVKTPEANKLRQDLLFGNIDDPWMQIAALSAPESHRGLLDAVLARFSEDSPAYASLVERLSAMTAQTKEKETIQKLITQATSASQKKFQGPILEGLAQGLKSKGETGSSFASIRPVLLKAFFQHPSAAVRNGCLNVLKAIGLPEGSETKAALQRA